MGREGQVVTGPTQLGAPFLGQRGRQGLLSPCSPGEQGGHGWPRPPPMSPHTKERQGWRGGQPLPWACILPAGSWGKLSRAVL